MLAASNECRAVPGCGGDGGPDDMCIYPLLNEYVRLPQDIFILENISTKHLPSKHITPVARLSMFCDDLADGMLLACAPVRPLGHYSTAVVIFECDRLARRI